MFNKRAEQEEDVFPEQFTLLSSESWGLLQEKKVNKNSLGVGSQNNLRTEPPADYLLAA